MDDERLLARTLPPEQMQDHVARTALAALEQILSDVFALAAHPGPKRTPRLPPSYDGAFLGEPAAGPPGPGARGACEQLMAARWSRWCVVMRRVAREESTIAPSHPVVIHSASGAPVESRKEATPVVTAGTRKLVESSIGRVCVRMISQTLPISARRRRRRGKCCIHGLARVQVPGGASRSVSRKQQRTPRRRTQTPVSTRVGEVLVDARAIGAEERTKTVCGTSWSPPAVEKAEEVGRGRTRRRSIRSARLPSLLSVSLRLPSLSGDERKRRSVSTSVDEARTRNHMSVLLVDLFTTSRQCASASGACGCKCGAVERILCVLA